MSAERERVERPQHRGGAPTGRARPLWREPETARWLAASRHVGHVVEVAVAADRAGAAGAHQPARHVGRLVVVARMVAGMAGSVAVLQPAQGTAVAVSLATVVTIRRTT